MSDLGLSVRYATIDLAKEEHLQDEGANPWTPTANTPATERSARGRIGHVVAGGLALVLLTGFAVTANEAYASVELAELLAAHPNSPGTTPRLG